MDSSPPPPPPPPSPPPSPSAQAQARARRPPEMNELAHAVCDVIERYAYRDQAWRVLRRECESSRTDLARLRVDELKQMIVMLADAVAKVTDDETGSELGRALLVVVDGAGGP